MITVFEWKRPNGFFWIDAVNTQFSVPPDLGTVADDNAVVVQRLDNLPDFAGVPLTQATRGGSMDGDGLWRRVLAVAESLGVHPAVISGAEWLSSGAPPLPDLVTTAGDDYYQTESWRQAQTASAAFQVAAAAHAAIEDEISRNGSTPALENALQQANENSAVVVTNYVAATTNDHPNQAAAAQVTVKAAQSSVQAAATVGLHVDATPLHPSNTGKGSSLMGFYRFYVIEADGKIDSGSNVSACSRSNPGGCAPIQFTNEADCLAYAQAHHEIPVRVTSADEAFDMMEGKIPIPETAGTTSYLPIALGALYALRKYL